MEECVNLEEDDIWMVDPRPFSYTSSIPPPSSSSKRRMMEEVLRRSSLVGDPTMYSSSQFVKSIIRFHKLGGGVHWIEFHPNHSSSYVVLAPSSVVLVVVPPPSGRPPPSPPTLRVETRKRVATSSRRRVFGRFRQKA